MKLSELKKECIKADIQKYKERIKNRTEIIKHLEEVNEKDKEMIKKIRKQK